MNTKRSIISEIETLAVNAIVSQPDSREEADAHFSATAKKIMEKAILAVDLEDVTDVCRRALTGAAIQDYDLLANLLTDPDLDRARLQAACDRAAEKRGTPASGQPTAPSTNHQAPSTNHQAPLTKRIAKTPQSIVIDFKYPSGRRLSAEWEAEATDHAAQAWLYDGQQCVARITFFGCYQSRTVGNAITKGALYALTSRAGHMGRYRDNRAARLAAEEKGGAK